MYDFFSREVLLVFGGIKKMFMFRKYDDIGLKLNFVILEISLYLCLY